MGYTRRMFMSHKEDHNKEVLIKRINRIEGQIGGIRKMILEEKSFDDIIIQLNASQAALQKMSDLLFEAHLEHCFYEAVEAGNAARSLENLRNTLKQYSKMI